MIKTTRKGSGLDMQLTRPHSDALCLILEGQVSIIPLIISLLYLCGPITIIWFVIAIIITSLQGILNTRPFAHVCEKVFEPVPALTNANSALSIIFILFAIRLFTTFSHVKPNIINRSFTTSMGGIQISDTINFQTSATTGVSIFQPIRFDVHDIAAYAQAIIGIMAVPQAAISKYGEIGKGLIRQVSTFRISIRHRIKTHPFNFVIRAAAVLNSPLRSVVILPQFRSI